jgi:protein subunit release factor B
MKDDLRAAIRRGSAPRKRVTFGAQIRSYVLDSLYVKDHRTGVVSNDPSAVLDGAIDPFITAELERQAYCDSGSHAERRDTK